MSCIAAVGRPEPVASRTAGASSSSSSITYTLDTAVNGARLGCFQFCLFAFVAVAWAADAMEITLVSFLGPAVKCAWSLSDADEALLAAIVFAGMVVGGPIWGVLADSCGRKTAFIVSTSTAMVFSLASAIAPNLQALMAFRALVGVGVSNFGVTFSLAAEFVPDEHRGFLLVVLDGMWTLGTLTQAALVAGLLNPAGWRVLVAVTSTPYVVVVLLSAWLPESPRYCMVKGQTERADAIIARMYRWNKRPLPCGKLLPLEGAALTHKEAQQQASAGGRKASPLRRALASPLLQPWRELAAPQLRVTVVVLTLIWLAAATFYFGIVQLVAQIELVDGGSNRQGQTCQAGKLFVQPSGLATIVITSVAEVPGLLLAMGMTWIWKGSTGFAGPFLLAAVSLIPRMAGVTGVGSTASLFLSRMFIMCVWCLLSGLTPQRYHTSARSTGVSLNNSICRIGGFISPYIVILARQTGWQHSPEAVFCGLAVAAAGASALLLPRQHRVQAVADTLLPLQRGGGAQQGSFLSFVAAQLSRRSSGSGSMLPVTAPPPPVQQQQQAAAMPAQQQARG